MIVCFDIGGSFIKPARATAPDRVEAMPAVATPGDDFARFLKVLQDAIAKAGGTPERIALSISGVIDIETGVATCATIACIHGCRLVADLEAALGLEVLVANDADCFVLAEGLLGAGRGHDTVFGIILGSGVGGGLVVDGRLANRAGGFGGEWGHGPALASFAGDPPVEIPVIACPCGQSRCVTTLGGARGLERLHRHLTGEARTSREIVSAWEDGGEAAHQTIAIYLDLISAPLALAINITGASIVPAGGGLSKSARLIAAIDLAVRARILRRFDRPLVVPGALALEPGLIGAALLALQSERP